MNPKIIFEDETFIIFDKPAGWIVDEAKTNRGKPVIQTWLKEHYDYEIAKSKKYRSGIVHRLDKETSGLLIVAKTKAAFKDLQGQFKKRKVIKAYLALLHGKLEPEEGGLEVPVGRLPWNKERFGVVPGGKNAQTRYKVIGSYKKDNKDFSLVEFYPKTGRTHQIRIHAKYLGHPIVSDTFYAGRKRARSDRDWCPRLFLHAKKISFRHPKTGKKVSYKSALSEDLEESLHSLEKTA